MLSLNLTHLIDDAKCYETVRQMRWTTGVCCPKWVRPQYNTTIRRQQETHTD
jgi:hypothetical protein